MNTSSGLSGISPVQTSPTMDTTTAIETVLDVAGAVSPVVKAVETVTETVASDPALMHRLHLDLLHLAHSIEITALTYGHRTELTVEDVIAGAKKLIAHVEEEIAAKL
jgi:hypothetical protein